MSTYLVTNAHLEFLKNSLNIMGDFYCGKPKLLLESVANNYGVSMDKSADAIQLFMSTGICEYINSVMQDVCQELTKNIADAKKLNMDNDDVYHYEIQIRDEILTNASKVFDLYSRVMMGQFSEIYSVISDSLDANKKDWNIKSFIVEQAIADFRWSAPYTMVDARNTLIPYCSGMEWSGNLGISYTKTCMEAKLSYEIAKVFGQQDFEKRTGRKDCILHVSGLPLLKTAIIKNQK